ncbi:uncharacterized protein LOC124954862 isoform X2 [Vespa velutina]|uniref:uncharacterized protein LOC124954862 isoform X2 n=1 Tax=Vespa velutina TaxID=202808 RepID=UPI001FB4B13D|nr:uncharacterized protein LOC124954862 isoform X2 [Vespa velutina]
MFNAGSLSVLLTGLLVIVVIQDVSSYSKYGRSCKDIGCRSDEVCVMAEDPCTDYSDKCGRYPTCKKMNDRETSCASIICNENDYCRNENGMPKCVRKVASNGFESAGVDIVNGQHVSSSDTNKHTNTNTNPFANANAPPAPADPIPGGNGYQVNSGTNLGYPSYPSNVGTSNSNHGYPPYPSTNRGNQPQTDNLGYPPYPTMNRMPQPGQGYPGQGYPPYPGQSGYPQTGYPQQQYPNGQRYPYHIQYHQHHHQEHMDLADHLDVLDPEILSVIILSGIDCLEMIVIVDLMAVRVADLILNAQETIIIILTLPLIIVAIESGLSLVKI